MKKILLSGIVLLVLLSTLVSATTALPVDAYISFEGSPTGGAYIVSGGGSLSTQGSPTVSSIGTHALRGPVSVNGVVYNGASSQALTINNDHTYEDIVFNAAATHDVFSFAGFITTGATTTYAMIDMFYIDNTAGNSWLCAPQLMDEGSCHHCVELEGSLKSVGGSTTHGDSSLPKWELPIQAGKTYWFSTKVDTPGRRLYLSIFDPDNNYTLVGQHDIETDGLAGKLLLRMGRADNHPNDPQGSYSYVDNIIIDWTNHVYPLIPGSTISPSSVAGDVNGDGKVDITDLSSIAKYFGVNSSNSKFDANFDFIVDGVIDIADLSFVAKRFTQ
jgi:hypothetical protein